MNYKPVLYLENPYKQVAFLHFTGPERAGTGRTCRAGTETPDAPDAPEPDVNDGVSAAAQAPRVRRRTGPAYPAHPAHPVRSPVLQNDIAGLYSVLFWGCPVNQGVDIYHLKFGVNHEEVCLPSLWLCLRRRDST